MSGQLFWITGLSGAGKTTIGTLLYNCLKAEKNNVILLDGDGLREIYNDNDYSLDGRKYNALRTSRLCKVLTEQGIDVVVCIIAMFHECRKWNRENITNYKEIYLKVSIKELIKRDQKQLYSRALREEVSNVMGIDLEFEEPHNPDMIIYNERELTPDKVLKMIVDNYNL